MNPRRTGRAQGLLVFAAVILLVATACSKHSRPAATATAEPTAASLKCPVDQAICDFATAVEKLVQTRDWATIGATSPGIIPGIRQQADLAIPGGTPKLVTIGCPYGAVSESCSRFFSLVFTTLQPTDDWTGNSGIFILMYERRPDPLAPQVRMVNMVAEWGTRRSALAGGMAQEPCNFSGFADDQGENGCSRSSFHPYSTDGVPFIPIDVRPESPFQVLAATSPTKDSAAFIATGCWGCEGYDSGIQAVITDSAGNSVVRALPEPPLRSNETRTFWEMTPDASLWIAGTCSGSNCGPLGPDADDVNSRILASSDGGGTWTELAAFPGYAYAEIGPNGNVLVTRTYGHGPASTWKLSWKLLPAGGEIVRPANASADARPLFLPDGSVGWHTYESPEVLRADGTAFFSAAGKFTANDQIDGFRFGPDGRVYVSWSTGRQVPGGPLKMYLSAFNPAGVELWRHQVEGSSAPSLQFRIGRFISSRYALGNIQDPSPSTYGQLPALVDFDAGTIQPFGAPFGLSPLTGRNTFLARVSGTFVVVATGGDCLNIRESASTASKSLVCVADGTPLKAPGETAQTEGRGWAKVQTLGGLVGWASSEFLR